MLVSNLLAEWGLDRQSLCDTFFYIDSENPPHNIEMMYEQLPVTLWYT